MILNFWPHWLYTNVYTRTYTRIYLLRKIIGRVPNILFNCYSKTLVEFISDLETIDATWMELYRYQLL